MNPVYIRVAFYALAGFVAAVGFGTFDAEAGTLTLDLDDLSAAVAASSFLSAVVFGLWGKK